MVVKISFPRCQACPQSSRGSLGQASDRPLNPPLVFVIDTTKSVKPDKDSIFNLTGKVTDRIMKDRINIPRYTLFSFNDYGPAINLNVKLEVRRVRYCTIICNCNCVCILTCIV